MSKLPFRLQKIAELVTGKRVCDIGCDHGKLAEYLLSSGKVESVIVSDISRPSLQKAIDLLSAKDYNFEYICCDGLEGYSGKSVDQGIIAGMGGDEIIKIISNSPIEINSYILSPQHNNIDVKKFLLSHGYNIDYDVIIRDKSKFYNIIRCYKSNKVREYSDLQLVIGEANYIDPDSCSDEFVKNEILKVDRILDGNKIENQDLVKYIKILKQYKRN